MLLCAGAFADSTALKNRLAQQTAKNILAETENYGNGGASQTNGGGMVAGGGAAGGNLNMDLGAFNFGQCDDNIQIMLPSLPECSCNFTDLPPL